MKIGVEDKKLLFSFLFVALCLIGLLSCTKHIPVERGQRAWENERIIYVTLLSGEKFQVKKPRIEGEYLIGMTPANIALPGDKEIKIALEDIKRIEIERIQRTKTVIALLLVALPVGFMIWLMIEFRDGFGLQ